MSRFKSQSGFRGARLTKSNSSMIFVSWNEMVTGDVITKDYKMGALVVTGDVIANLGQGEHILNLLLHLLWFGDRQHIVCRNNLEQNTRQIVNSCLSTT